MPKNRHNRPAANSAQTTREPAPGSWNALTGVAAVALLAAIGCTGVLVAESLGFDAVPGCGPDGGCANAAESAFGKLPLGGGRSWPASYLGFAWYVAMLVGLVVNRRRGAPAFKGLAVLGGLVSVFYLGVIVLNWGEYACPWCIGSHAANFVFIGALLARRGGKSGQGGPSTGLTIGTVAGAFLLTTGALAGLDAMQDARLTARGEKEAEEDTRNIIERSQRNRQGDDEQPPTTTTEDDDPVAAREAIAEDHPGLAATAYRTDGAGFTGRYRLGPEEAKVRLVVFSSYACKYCATLEGEIKGIIEERDDVSFSHKHFPMDKVCNEHITRTIHPKACEAAYIAEAVGELYGPAAFWRYHDAFYEQLRKEERFTALSLLRELGYAGREAVALAERSGEIQSRVVDDIDEALALGLRQTPTVFINGQEFRGWYATGALARAVAQIAQEVEPGTPAMDRPGNAIDKYVEDYFASRQRLRDLGEDTTVTFIGREDAPIDLQVFFAYETDDTLSKLAAFDDVFRKYPENVRMTLRHYPWSEACNMFSQVNFRMGEENNSCAMHRALEAAARLGGNEAAAAAYRWMVLNGAAFDESMLEGFASEVGVDYAELQETMADDTINDALFNDARWLSDQKMRAVVPIIFVNGRRVERYSHEGDHTTVLERIIRRELGIGG